MTSYIQLQVDKTDHHLQRKKKKNFNMFLMTVVFDVGT